MEEDKKKSESKQDFIEFLKEKKANGGKLNRLGEWLLSKGETGLYIKDEDMKYILRLR